ncbi:Low-density lipoprotein receptor-related protein 1B, partial [Varanus komodoensis]
MSTRSIAIIVPLVLLVTLITTLVIGLLLCKRKRRTKTIRRQPIINGGINVEIGNPSYNMYEVGHNHSERGLSDFTLNPEKISAHYLGQKPVQHSHCLTWIGGKREVELGVISVLVIPQPTPPDDLSQRF